MGFNAQGLFFKNLGAF